MVTVILYHLRWAVLTVLWVGFCHSGPISLCILHICCIIVSTVGWTGWDWSLILRTYLPSVLWHCWLGHLTRNNPSPRIAVIPISTLVWPVLVTGFKQHLQIKWPCDFWHATLYATTFLYTHCWQLHTHTHTQPFYCWSGICPGPPGSAGTRKVKPRRLEPIWIYWSKR